MTNLGRFWLKIGEVDAEVAGRSVGGEGVMTCIAL